MYKMERELNRLFNDINIVNILFAYYEEKIIIYACDKTINCYDQTIRAVIMSHDVAKMAKIIDNYLILYGEFYITIIDKKDLRNSNHKVINYDMIKGSPADNLLNICDDKIFISTDKNELIILDLISLKILKQLQIKKEIFKVDVYKDKLIICTTDSLLIFVNYKIRDEFVLHSNNPLYRIIKDELEFASFANIIIYNLNTNKSKIINVTKHIDNITIFAKFDADHYVIFNDTDKILYSAIYDKILVRYPPDVHFIYNSQYNPQGILYKRDKTSISIFDMKLQLIDKFYWNSDLYINKYNYIINYPVNKLIGFLDGHLTTYDFMTHERYIDPERTIQAGDKIELIGFI